MQHHSVLVVHSVFFKGYEIHNRKRSTKEKPRAARSPLATSREHSITLPGLETPEDLWVETGGDKDLSGIQHYRVYSPKLPIASKKQISNFWRWAVIPWDPQTPPGGWNPLRSQRLSWFMEKWQMITAPPHKRSGTGFKRRHWFTISLLTLWN